MYETVYCRFDRGLLPRESVALSVRDLNAKAVDLRKTLAAVRSRRDKLREKLGMEIPSPKQQSVDTSGKLTSSNCYSYPVLIFKLKWFQNPAFRRFLCHN